MEYKTIDITTLEGMDEADRLYRAGWTIYRPGMFTIVLRSPVATQGR